MYSSVTHPNSQCKPFYHLYTKYWDRILHCLYNGCMIHKGSIGRVINGYIDTALRNTIQRGMLQILLQSMPRALPLVALTLSKLPMRTSSAACFNIIAAGTVRRSKNAYPSLVPSNRVTIHVNPGNFWSALTSQSIKLLRALNTPSIPNGCLVRQRQ